MWYHTCPSRGKKCNNTELVDFGGCAIWYDETQVILSATSSGGLLLLSLSPPLPLSLLLLLLQAITEAVLDNQYAFLEAVDRMELVRDGILKQWMRFIISLDKHYHTHLEQLLAQMKEKVTSSEISLAEAKQCSEEVELEGRGISEVVDLWTKLQVHMYV